jgi:hypothetical protein
MDCPSKKLDTYVFNFAKLGQFCHVHKYSFNHGHYSSNATSNSMSPPPFLQFCWDCTKDGYELGFQAQTRAQRQDDFMITLKKKSNAIQSYEHSQICCWPNAPTHYYFSLWKNMARVVDFWDSFWFFGVLTMFPICSHQVPNGFQSHSQCVHITLGFYSFCHFIFHFIFL